MAKKTLKQEMVQLWEDLSDMYVSEFIGIFLLAPSVLIVILLVIKKVIG